MKLMDAIGLSLIVIGIALTALSFKRAESASTEVQSVTIQEITPRAPANKI